MVTFAVPGPMEDRVRLFDGTFDRRKKKPVSTKTYLPKQDEIKKAWWVIDAQDKILGRLATRAAVLLQGKHKPTFTPHLETGDYVVVVNAEKIAVTGKKLDDKVYYRHSGRLGSLKEQTLGERLEKHPERVILEAVRRMLPKSRLGRKMLTRLKVYVGPEHPHVAQQPAEYKIA